MQSRRSSHAMQMAAATARSTIGQHAEIINRRWYDPKQAAGMSTSMPRSAGNSISRTHLRQHQGRCGGPKGLQD
eukprot:4147377-Prymnesium_polylepis.1